MSQYETYETYETEAFEGPFEGQFESYETEAFELNEVQEAELAAELLEITNEAELEEFLGGIVKAAGNFLKSPAGKAIGGVLKDVAKTALPVVGGALGSFVAPGVGTAIGSQLGSMASNLFEMGYETETENEQFEVAKKVIQLATNAAQIAQAAPPDAHPLAVAQHSVAQAARELGIHAEVGETELGEAEFGGGGYGGGYRRRSPQGYGGYSGGSSSSWGGRAQSGRWYRRGRRIVLHGV